MARLEADIPEGTSEQVVRTASEYASSLEFSGSAFQEARGVITSDHPASFFQHPPPRKFGKLRKFDGREGDDFSYDVHQ